MAEKPLPLFFACETKKCCRSCKEIPLLGEMSAKQTKGFTFSEKKGAERSEADEV